MAIAATFKEKVTAQYLPTYDEPEEYKYNGSITCKNPMLNSARSIMKQPAILFGEDFGKFNKRLPISFRLILIKKVILYV